MKKLTLLGVICLALVLAAMPFMAACGEEEPAPVTPAPPPPPAPPVTPVTPAPAPVVVPAPAGEPVYNVLDPRGIEPERELFPLAPRLDTLEGKTVNVINLHGGNEDAYMTIVPALKAAVPTCNVVYFRTDGGFAGNRLTDDDWANMMDCDAAITGHNF